jgi:hypothetical protein
MKKLAILTIVVTLLAISAVPAFAAGGPPANRGTASGDCTGNQVSLGTGYQASLGSGNQTGFGPSYQASLGTGNQIGFGVRTPFALSGIIKALDPSSKTVTVEVSCGNRVMKEYIGTQVTLQTNNITRFLERNDDGSATPITFEELVEGQTVSSHGILVDEVFTATRITMGALLYCLP